MSRQPPLDDKDQQIVDLLTNDAWQTNAQIGAAINLSPSAVQRRIDNLKRRGVVAGAKAIIGDAYCERRVRLYLLLELSADNAGGIDALVADLRKDDCVSSADLVTGKYDVLVTIDAESMQAFSDYAMNVINKNTNIRHCFTLTRLTEIYAAKA